MDYFKKKFFLFLIVLLIFFSGRALFIIPKEGLQDTALTTIQVSLFKDALSSEDAEVLLLKPLEEQVQHMPGLIETRGVISRGEALLFLDFDASLTSSEALQHTLSRVSNLHSKLPVHSRGPFVSEVDESLIPLVRINLSGVLEKHQLYAIADDLQAKILAQVPGVLEATIQGRKKDVVEVLLDPNKVESYGLLSPLLVDTFSKNTQGVQGEDLHAASGAISVSVPGLFKSLSDIEKLSIKNESDGTLRIKDVGYVNQTYTEPTAIFRENGAPVVSLRITKKRGFNLLDTVGQLNALLITEKNTWPQSLMVSVIQDASKTILEIINDLKNRFFTGLILVSLMILCAFGWRSSLLIGGTLALCHLLTFLVLEIFGESLNIFILFSLIISIGICLAPSILIVDCARDNMHEGVPPKEAYGKAFSQNALLVLTSTLISISTLAPFCFWPGPVGHLMASVPRALLVSIGLSSITALLFAPVLATSFFKKPKVSSHETNMFLPLTKWSLRWLERALRKPCSVLFGLIVLFLSIGILIAAFGKIPMLYPSSDTSRTLLLVHARGSLSLEEKDALIQKVESSIEAHSEVTTCFTQINELPKSLPDDVIALIYLSFDQASPQEKQKVLAQIEDTTSKIGSVLVEFRHAPLIPALENTMNFSLSGASFEELESTSKSLQNFLSSLPTVISVQNNSPLPSIEWEMTINQGEAAKFDASTYTAGMAIQILGSGLKLGEFKPKNLSEEIPIVGRFPRSHRSLSELQKMSITTNKGLVPLSNFVTLKPSNYTGSSPREWHSLYFSFASVFF